MNDKRPEDDYIQFGNEPLIPLRKLMRQSLERPPLKNGDITGLFDALAAWPRKKAREAYVASGLAKGPAKAAALRVAAAKRRDTKAFNDFQRRNHATLIVRGRPLGAEARLRAYERSMSPSPRRLQRLQSRLAAGTLPPLK
jgi:hypothetical protein